MIRSHHTPGNFIPPPPRSLRDPPGDLCFKGTNLAGSQQQFSHNPRPILVNLLNTLLLKPSVTASTAQSVLRCPPPPPDRLVEHHSEGLLLQHQLLTSWTQQVQWSMSHAASTIQVSLCEDFHPVFLGDVEESKDEASVMRKNPMKTQMWRNPEMKPLMRKNPMKTQKRTII